MAQLTDTQKITGLFAGLSLEGTVLIERKDANRDFYGSPVPAKDILGGRVPPPEVASRLYEIIEAAEGLDETGLPEEAYVPTPAGGHMNLASNQMVFDADSHHWALIFLSRMPLQILKSSNFIQLSFLVLFATGGQHVWIYLFDEKNFQDMYGLLFPTWKLAPLIYRLKCLVAQKPLELCHVSHVSYAIYKSYRSQIS